MRTITRADYERLLEQTERPDPVADAVPKGWTGFQIATKRFYFNSQFELSEHHVEGGYNLNRRLFEDGSEDGEIFVDGQYGSEECRIDDLSEGTHHVPHR